MPELLTDDPLAVLIRWVAEAPPSWTTIRLEPDRMDFWQGGTETSPQTKTRFVRETGRWRHFPVLP